MPAPSSSTSIRSSSSGQSGSTTAKEEKKQHALMDSISMLITDLKAKAISVGEAMQSEGDIFKGMEDAIDDNKTNVSLQSEKLKVAGRAVRSVGFSKCFIFFFVFIVVLLVNFVIHVTSKVTF
ncbi:hypothetical protein ADUPG1_010877 [Aduncisulcus paluster]|uniref:t-SNARE coiled-coil homology domain-containing protein n=2 Tax=Aduncisulcus paluster TaxID=2918883 RepID=A0ABQ5JT84_9EUKA|nr:hypothetical protein ADUPG1_010877 [Aduncisulcus paluster]|eukprot:gnl/Carplike_NY0171/8209_a11394_111.p1 GENE.gnl/Carplike_NY0171/8209_a11394_111~~gnl/Carplike_NY0171/8209_a11394_111.p1  ORF type:complete len:123 (+),score=38.84 gnl/Carplike_NY0171/8209_a11394_111:3-371(+)